MREARLLLSDILECIERIESYTIEGREAFLQGRIIQDAVARNLEVIGEATKQLPPSLKESYPDVPWKRIAGLRDVLIHDYVRVDPEEVWRVVEQNLPGLKTNITAIFQELNPS
ncbi:hypothetical protein NIES2135_19170 [Leptolyngbya boryana NIES-2135]|jgi:uncharacterized protein with HEPN domain|uniref:DUF86 domain-containing protein n=1 Tax=Leptolyngbya boryana NIES-2135 TaxID=1973484 RepID=A0A1Z4JED5_LEPBY|nr:MULTISPECIES: DUF86 domain-containing protein [Leptolyngbya]BAY55096.1 hypothetical protein NIES2135_19170 [Leptolyngbya boryana NIES-2135]MBD2366076.1 DUF86 domain-containing protein [Leptolyngbya sp. FACHB-161]MBD2372256.1 DUF86 domain-containing protein [Leptolyngbya sp. FACHB-238]MBD2396679.1 DUF86 domain-containing protein [Leptolyngbya sp. FACHB-239]MBD2403202.1 DUF86 domain-containing protein [Leptolyngbya sp. FACHB-402]